MRKILLVFALSLSTMISFGQFALGVKGGVNANSTPHSDEVQGYTSNLKTAVGWHLGVYSQINISEKLSFIPELMFIKRGVGYKNGSAERLNLNYIELPLYLSYAPVKIIQIDLGPSLSNRVSAKFVSGSRHDDASALFDKKFELGLAGGIRINLTKKLSAMAHAYRGLTNIAEISIRDANNSLSGESKFYNFNVQLSLGYKLFKL